MTDKATDDLGTGTEDTKTVEPKIDLGEYKALKAEVDRLKNFHSTVLEEKKIEEAKRKDAEAKARQEIAEKDGNWKEVIEITKQQFKEELEKRDNELAQYRQKEKDKMVLDEASRIADQLTKHAGRKTSLVKEIKERLKLTEDGIKVVDEKGNLTTDNLESLTIEIKTRFDWLVDAVDSSGSGTKGTNTTSGVRNLKDMSEAEIRTLYRANPEKYRELVRQQK